MNKVLIMMVLLVITGCSSPSINGGPKTISCSNAAMVLEVPAGALQSWESANKYHTYEIENGRIFVTLSSIEPGYLSRWLYENNTYIRFVESSGAILCHHKIPNIRRFDLEKVAARLTLKQIKEELAKTNHRLTDSYQQFIGISFNSGNAFTLEAATSFEPNKYYYSMAFFMAVERTNEMNETTLFTFHKATYRDEPVIVIEVNGRYQNYYDFAQYPPLR